MEKSRRGLILAVVLLASLLIGLASVFVWREWSRRKVPITAASLHERFPGYFRNLTEQEVFQQIYFKSLENPNYVENITQTNETCSINCRQQLGFRKRRSSSNYVSHGCCKSKTNFIHPKKLPNINKQKRILAQFETKKQYFLNHDCKRVPRCSGCRCAQADSYQAGVVIKDDDADSEAEYIDELEIDFLQLTGCCICINN